MLQFDEEPKRREIASAVGASMFARKIIFQQQPDLPLLLLAMLVLVC
jgi:hypothetical protein